MKRFLERLDIFTTPQQRVVKVLERNAYKQCGRCFRYESALAETLSGYPTPIPVPVCDYVMLTRKTEKGEEMFVVGDIASFYYGPADFFGQVSTLKSGCLHKDKSGCGLRSISEQPGRAIDTQDLLNQLRKKYAVTLR